MSQQASPDAMAALSVAVAVPGLWAFLCPPVLDQDPYADPVLRLQQVKAAFASLGLGVAGSLIVRKPWPFLVTVVMTVLMLLEYESSRRRVSVVE